ncbi:MAG: SpoIID/LytB domain-containing protein [Bacteroidales bacterium]|nr:SpoIID/LytB domain-containing protein [Bacteroidales bacterium]
MKRILSLFFILGIFVALKAEHIAVRIYTTANITLLNTSFDLGSYNLYANDTLLIDSLIGTGHSVEFKAIEGQVNLSVDGHNYGRYNKARLQAIDSACILCLNPANGKQRTYEGSMDIRSKNGRLLLINDVDFETYLAGVAQSEIYGHESDIYRVQAVISRTWAMRNINKHAAEGFNFCDDVHCQAYHNRCIRPEIMLGTLASTGETIVDASGNLIETPFHANSGGQTSNSEDVWKNAVPYLRSVPDTFSLSMKQAHWSKKIKADKWLNYFAKNHGINTKDKNLRDSLLHFQQPQRRADILGVRLVRVRMDFGLRSTFFNVTFDSVRNEITLNGHGYGHGVGLSQEGTINMVRQGISYDSIIRHYYTGAYIKNDRSIEEEVRTENLTRHIETIIEEDRQKTTQKKSKQDDWLGRLFRILDREEREEVYDEKKQDLEDDWKYEW